MKNIIRKIILVSTVIAAFASCSNFLEQEPDTLLSPEQVYSTQEGVEAAVNGLYASMADYNYYGAAWHGLVNPHSGRMWSFQTITNDATSLNCGTENRWLVVLWDQMYRTISAANNIIANMETSTLPNRDTALGQAYFIRGFVYFDMVRLWGGVPLRVKPTTQNDLYLPKSTKQQVYDQIFADFHKAEQLLPEKGVLAIDRPTKYTVAGYLAKVYMQLAGEDGGNPALWQNAWDEAIKLYGKYSLVSNYASLFDPKTENTSESIFELQFGHYGTVRTSDMIRMYTPNNSIYITKFDTYGWVRPNKETYDQQKTQYPTDPRLTISFIADSYPKVTGGVQNVYPKTTTGKQGYVVIKKWFDASYDGTTTDRNLPLFRYADLLLMLAEIRNEIDGNPANAYQYVNPVLARARNSAVAPAVVPAVAPADWSGMTQQEFRDRIMQERKFELLSEGQDWFDARRRGLQYFLDKTVIPHNTHPKIAVGNLDYLYPTSNKAMLLPIPQTEIAANPKMSSDDQNPGYK